MGLATAAASARRLALLAVWSVARTVSLSSLMAEAACWRLEAATSVRCERSSEASEISPAVPTLSAAERTPVGLLRRRSCMSSSELSNWSVSRVRANTCGHALVRRQVAMLGEARGVLYRAADGPRQNIGRARRSAPMASAENSSRPGGPVG